MSIAFRRTLAAAAGATVVGMALLGAGAAFADTPAPQPKPTNCVQIVADANGDFTGAATPVPCPEGATWVPTGR